MGTGVRDVRVGVGVGGSGGAGDLDRLDQAIDAAFEPLRGRPEVDRAAAVLSNLADYGFVWVALALFKARRRGPGRRRAVLALAAAGFSSLFVNRAVKAAVARERPEDHLDVAVRAPSSSSFPSGHTLAAFCTAFVLAETDAQTIVNVGFAGAVAASRVHLRAHHPSDVVGGAAIGSVLGLGLRPIVDLVAPGRAGRTGRSGGRSAKAAGRVGRARRARRADRSARRDVVTQRL
jgi:undecaprenyl-diphosphatase